MPAYLSDEWIEAMAEAVAASPEVAAAAQGLECVIVTEVEDRAWQLRADGSGVRVVAGSSEGADLVVRQDRATAVAVATGALNPGRAFLDGRIRISGSADVLVRCRELLGALEQATASVREGTTHA